MNKTLIALAVAAAGTATHAADVKITLTQLTPSGGVGIAPLWVGFHNGGFDSFSAGQAASLGIERAAEDGDASQLTAVFGATATAAGGIQGTLPGPPAFSGDVRSLSLTGLDLAGANRYFSYAAMVVLSNDFFIGNDNAKQFDLASLASGGKISLLIGGAGQVWDAGTEVNDFRYSLANAAFGIGGGQTAANQGTDEHGVVHLVTGNPYPGFASQDLVPAGYQWGNLDFSNQGAFARVDIEVSAVPEPSTYAMLLAGLGLAAIVVRRRSRAGAA